MRIALCALFVAAACAANITSAKAPVAATPFPDLATLDLKQEGVRIRYPADKATRVDAPAAYLKSYEEAGVYASQPLRFELGHGLPPSTLTCDSGPSADPSCRLLANADDPGSTIFESSGKEFVFLANGEIYVFGQSDTLYDHRRLFRYDGKRYAEVAQPFRYVGIQGTTNAALALTVEKGGDVKHALITLAAKTPLTILLNAASGDDEDGQNADYLVKTREGLVGWAHIPMQPDSKTIVEGLYFAGD